MPKTQVTRLTIVWSKDIDLALRSHLGLQGLKKGALSQFVEDAVKWHMFDQTVNQTREAFADIPPDELQELIDEAVVSSKRKTFERKRGPRK